MKDTLSRYFPPPVLTAIRKIHELRQKDRGLQDKAAWEAMFNEIAPVRERYRHYLYFDIHVGMVKECVFTPLPDRLRKQLIQSLDHFEAVVLAGFEDEEVG